MYIPPTLHNLLVQRLFNCCGKFLTIGPSKVCSLHYAIIALMAYFDQSAFFTGEVAVCLWLPCLAATIISIMKHLY